jgi:catechol 2,3-dioxygenase-like lactoylglutathione lyase family enzyme
MGVCNNIGVQLTQVRLIVSDFAAVAAYYRDVIGLTPQFPRLEAPYAAFKPEQGSSLSLHERADLTQILGEGVLRAAGPACDAAMVSLRVDDLDAYLAEVRARGAEVLAGPVDFGGRVLGAYLRDPEGNLIEIQQWLQVRDGGAVPSAN